MLVASIWVSVYVKIHTIVLFDLAPAGSESGIAGTT